MRKLPLALILTTVFVMQAQASTAFTQPAADTTAATADTIPAGFYVSAHATTGKLSNDSYGYSQSGYNTKNTLTNTVANGAGISVGYQDNQIDNNILNILQVKRVSYGLEFDAASANLEGQANTAGTLGNLQAQYANQAVFATVKMNVFQFWHFSPYVEAGVGYMQQTLNNYHINYVGAVRPVTLPAAQSTGPASQLGIGVDVWATQHVAASVGYRHVSTQSLSLPQQVSSGAMSSQVNLKTNQNQWIASLAYTF